MTPAELETAAVALYGRRWKAPLARALGLNERTVRYWWTGRSPIPPWVEVLLDAKIRLARLDAERIAAAYTRVGDPDSS